MKRFLISLLPLAVMTLSFGTTSAQIKENRSALIYYMPRTIVVLNVEYEEVTAERGIFYQYSETLLGSKDAVTADSHSFKLRGVSIGTRTVADTLRAFVVPLDAKTISRYSLSLNSKNILEAVNRQEADNTDKPTDNRTVRSNTRPAEKSAPTPDVLPLLEDQMMAGSVGKMAEGTAKLIYSLRENRLNLLAGETEHTPADGTAMRLVLNEMDKREAALTQLFTGKRTTRVLHKTLELQPEDSIDGQVIFRFSSHDGVVDADDLSGKPYIITLNAHRQQYAPADENDKPAEASCIMHNIPGSAEIAVSDGTHTLAERTIPVAQFGITVPLAADLFTKKKTTVLFNTRTGAIKGIR